MRSCGLDDSPARAHPNRPARLRTGKDGRDDDEVNVHVDLLLGGRHKSYALMDLNKKRGVNGKERWN